LRRHHGTSHPNYRTGGGPARFRTANRNPSHASAAITIWPEPGLEVVGEAGDGEAAVAAARRLRPDVVLMDIRMPVLDGIEATRRIVGQQLDTRVLMLTTFGLDEYVYEALRAGASGFMLKDAPPEEIVDAVRIVARGDALLAPSVTRAVVEAFARQPSLVLRPPEVLMQLTPRERDVLDLLVRGLSSPEICRELGIKRGDRQDACLAVNPLRRRAHSAGAEVAAPDRACCRLGQAFVMVLAQGVEP